MIARDTIRIAAVGDLHCKRTSAGGFQAMLAQVTETADILALCGDLTDYGTAEEAHILAKELTMGVKVPIVGVLGNHDYESGKEDEVRHILSEAGVVLLDGEATEIHGVGFAGVKGFAGGFGRCTLGAWGERGIKTFVQEAIQEALKLEAALARLRTHLRIALLHYSPIAATVEGEPPDIYPFLGTSRLEEPLTRYPIDAVFHGHAHSGSPEGKTVGGVPVYNVAMPMLRRRFPDSPPFKVIEFPLHEPLPPATEQSSVNALGA